METINQKAEVVAPPLVAKLRMDIPQLVIQGGTAGEFWGFGIKDGLVLAMELKKEVFTDERGAEAFREIWRPMIGMPPKLLCYMEVFIDQHQSWLRPRGMPVGSEGTVLLR